MKNKKSRRNDQHPDQHARDHSGRFTSEHTYQNMSGRNDHDYRGGENSYNADYARFGERDRTQYNDQTERNNHEFISRAENFNGNRGNHRFPEDMNYSRGSRNGNYDTNNMSRYDDDHHIYADDRNDGLSRERESVSTNGQSGRNPGGQFRGRGPKGYQRSDERIKEDINDRLTDDDQLDASEIEVTVEQGEVTINGSVSERNDKRRAEDIVESVSGVNHVENRIRVARGSQQQQSNEKNESKTRSKHTSEAH